MIGADGNHGVTHGDNQRDDHDDAEQLDTRVDNGIIERLNGADETAFVEIADDEDAQRTGQDDLFFEQECGEHGDRDDDIGDVQGSERDQGEPPNRTRPNTGCQRENLQTGLLFDAPYDIMKQMLGVPAGNGESLCLRLRPIITVICR